MQGGSLAKVLQNALQLLCKDSPTWQKHGIGIKEIWQVPPENFQPGLVQHTLGWPLGNKTGGGTFLYHFGDHYVAVGLVVHLNYKNPFISPFDEFQRVKHHPGDLPERLKGGKRIAYGPRRRSSRVAYQSVPKLTFPGGVLVGDSRRVRVNLPRIKGSHNAMKTGMLAAEAAFAAIRRGPRPRRTGRLRPAAYKTLLGPQGAAPGSAT